MTLAGGVVTGVDVPLVLWFPGAGGGLCDAARTKPWKMLPSTLDEAGRAMSGRLEKAADDGNVFFADAPATAAATDAACVCACCSWMRASRFAVSAASRSS